MSGTALRRFVYIMRLDSQTHGRLEWRSRGAEYIRGGRRMILGRKLNGA